MPFLLLVCRMHPLRVPVSLVEFGSNWSRHFFCFHEELCIFPFLRCLKKYLTGKVKKKKNSVHVVLMITLLTYICSKVTTYRKANFAYFRTRTERGQTGIITFDERYNNHWMRGPPLITIVYCEQSRRKYRVDGVDIIFFMGRFFFTSVDLQKFQTTAW